MTLVMLAALFKLTALKSRRGCNFHLPIGVPIFNMSLDCIVYVFERHPTVVSI